jgi:hypothetical protein
LGRFRQQNPRSIAQEVATAGFDNQIREIPGHRDLLIIVEHNLAGELLDEDMVAVVVEIPDGLFWQFVDKRQWIIPSHRYSTVALSTCPPQKGPWPACADLQICLWRYKYRPKAS